MAMQASAPIGEEYLLRNTMEGGAIVEIKEKPVDLSLQHDLVYQEKVAKAKFIIKEAYESIPYTTDPASAAREGLTADTILPAIAGYIIGKLFKEAGSENECMLTGYFNHMVETCGLNKDKVEELLAAARKGMFELTDEEIRKQIEQVKRDIYNSNAKLRQLESLISNYR